MAGDYDLQDGNSDQQFRYIKHVFIHPEYDAVDVNADIAVIILQNPLIFGPVVSSISLPDTDQQLIGKKS